MNELYNLFISAARVLKDQRINRKFSIILTFSRLRLKGLLYKALKVSPKSERIFGWKVSFFNYHSFVYLFEEIFINQCYHFNTNKTQPMIIDCGSNIGMSVLYFKWLYPESQVIAFEPDAETFILLKKNIEQNNLEGIILHNAALSDKEGTLTFFKPKTSGSLVMSALQFDEHEESVTVDAIPLSKILNQPIDYLKMDIEGGEGAVFKNLDETNTFNMINEMTIEYHHNRHPDNRLSSFLNILEKNNFKYDVSANPTDSKDNFLPQDVLLRATNQKQTN